MVAVQRLQVLNVACEACQKSIDSSKGKMVVKEAARAVSERDDRLLAEKMEALEAANREVSIHIWLWYELRTCPSIEHGTWLELNMMFGE